MSILHLHLLMTAQDYIISKLEQLRAPLELAKPPTDDELVEAITRLVLSKKFRKYSVSPENAEQIKSAVRLSIEKREPIKFTIVFGGYKLWRLPETPEADWAELFALSYYTQWVKPICALYEPGVWFDFFSEDVIVPRLNNIPPDDLDAYRDSFLALLAFLKPYQPANLNMTFTRVGDQYESLDEFETELQKQLDALSKSLDGGLPVLDDAIRAAVELNVKTTPEQEAGPQWREKVRLLHLAYRQISRRRPYYITPDKIPVTSAPKNGALAVGTTKDSIAKFWPGAGALKPQDESYRQLVLSPGQVQNGQFAFEPVSIPGLSGKNFHQIRVLKHEI